MIHGWAAVLLASVARDGFDVTDVHIDLVKDEISFEFGTMWNPRAFLGRELIKAAKELKVPFPVSVLAMDYDMQYRPPSSWQ